MIDLTAKLQYFETAYSIKNNIPTAIGLVLRLWQQAIFSPGATPHPLLQRASQTAIATHRRNPSDLSMYVTAIFIAIEAGNFHTAGEMLDKVFAYKNFLRSHNPQAYGLLCFLFAYLEINQNRIRSAKKYWRALKDHIKEHIKADISAGGKATNYSIMEGYLHLASQEYDEALSHFVTAHRGGSASIFMYMGLYKYYSTTLQKPEDSTILPTLLYAASRGVDITKTALHHQLALLVAVNHHHPMGYKLYQISQHPPLLQALVKKPLAAGDMSLAAYQLYKEAQDKQLAIPGLTLAIVQSAYIHRIHTINRYTLVQFFENTIPEGDMAVYLYHLLLTQQGLEDLIPPQQAHIIATAYSSLAQGLSSVAANSLYHYTWLQTKDPTLLKPLETALGKYQLSYNRHNPHIKHIYITQPEKEGITAIDISPDTADAEDTIISATGQDFTYTVLGPGKRSILQEAVTLHPLIPTLVQGEQGNPMALYQHFFHSASHGSRDFYITSHLANFYLNQPLSRSQDQNQALPIYEAILQHDQLSKAYRMRILVALGRLYYNNQDYALALDCYGQVDLGQLDPTFTAQVLEVFLHTKEWARALSLLFQNYRHLSPDIFHHTILALIPPFAGQQKPLETLAGLGYIFITSPVSENNFCQTTFDMVVSNLQASYAEWVVLYQIPQASCPALGHIIAQMALAMAVWDTHCQQAFAADLQPQYVQYATYQLLANHQHPTPDLLAALEDYCIEDPTDTLLVWALGQYYLSTKTTTAHSANIIALGLESFQALGILLPAFKDAGTSAIGRLPFVQKYQPFTHKGKPDRVYQLYYRINEDGAFLSIPMEYIKYGIYVACLPIFYGETITYYFSEELPTGSITTPPEKIKNTTPFLHETDKDPFFAINSAIVYEQMFKHEQVENIIGALVKDSVPIRAKLM